MKAESRIKRGEVEMPVQTVGVARIGVGCVKLSRTQTSGKMTSSFLGNELTGPPLKSHFHKHKGNFQFP